ncbi:ASKHA domain-containing protein [Acidobacteriota bacterium]
MSYTVKILSHNKKISAAKGDLLADCILKSGIDLSLYCNQKGMCGKCFVEIVDGILHSADDREKAFLKQKQLPQNYRLACKYKIKGNLTIKIPESSILQKTFILKTGIQLPLLIDPPVKKYYLELKKPELSDPQSSLELIAKYFRKKRMTIGLDVLKELPDLLESNKYRITVTVLNDDEILVVEPGDTTERNFGLAVDVGTSTLVVELVDLSKGTSLDIETANNSQMKYGLDVVSRITFAFTNPKNLNILQDSIIQTLSKMIHRLLKRNAIKPQHVYDIVIAGNTAMNHLLLGTPVNSLAVSPFHAVFRAIPEFPAAKLGFPINKAGKSFIVPNIKSFVGGDISAGLMATDLANRKGSYLFIDLGTNGEIVLKTEKMFIATSTAAGPAFEGMNISSGMLALPGAIFKAEKRKNLVLHTIGNAAPRGICGTGLIDLVALFLEDGKISPSGAIANKSKTISVAKNIAITQKDIREIQLAVAAIKSGIRMILKVFRLKKEQLDGVFIAGAFGNYLNIDNAMKLGLLPNIDPEKISFIGNSSLAGARALLLSKEARTKTEAIIKKIQYISLATDPQFQDYFIDALEFGDRSDTA